MCHGLIGNFRNTMLLCSGCQTLWAPRLILEIIPQAVNSILAEYSIPECGLGWVGSTNMDRVHLWLGDRKDISCHYYPERFLFWNRRRRKKLLGDLS